jgi:glycosyltransferase involved in cell wall biosynthesis
MTDKPYVLLSAYACEPGRGSEPGVGFAWLTRLLERGVRIALLTRANNVRSLERDTAKYVASGQLIVHGIDIGVLLKLKRIGVITVNAYYLLWQVRAYFAARRIIRERNPLIRLAWHLTFSGCRFPTFLPFLRTDCIIGPLGGEELVPMRFLPHIGIRGVLQESLRYAVNLFCRVNLINVLIYKKSSLVLFKTSHTARHYDRYCRASELRFEIGTGMTKFPRASLSPLSPDESKLQLIYVGRVLYWKGVRLLSEAFARALESGLQAELHIIGRGPDEKFLSQFIQHRNLQHALHLRGSVKHDEVHAAMSSADLFLMPSFRDSGGTVVIESLDVGTPVLALDLGGPGVLLGSDYPGLIVAKGRKYQDVVNEFANRLLLFSQSEEYRNSLHLRTRELRIERSFDKNFIQLMSHGIFRDVIPPPA